MKYYAVVQPTINEDSWLAAYLPAVSAFVAKHGGKYLARTQTMEKIEGDDPLPSAFIQRPRIPVPQEGAPRRHEWRLHACGGR
jgi:uncharacterized protein (DUF1330 family)